MSGPCIYVQKEGGVAVVLLDDPDASVNTLTERLGNELMAAFEALEGDGEVQAIVLGSRKGDFIVGANVDMLRGVRFGHEAERMARDLATRLGRLRSGAKPVVAAIHGQCLGGGYEVALACHAIVASSDRRTGVGLPEVKLGLLPGANGLLRVAERAGLQVALDLGLTGKTVRAAKAKAQGLVDEVCPEAVLLSAARQRALDLARGPGTRAKAPRTKAKASADTRLATLALEANPVGRRLLFKKAREETRRKTRGHYPGTERILDVLELYGKKGFAAAADLEARSFGELVVSETSHRLVEIFQATVALKKDTGTDDPKLKVRTPERIGVLGGGLMGGGIAYVSVDADVAVRLKDRDDAGVGRGLRYVKDILDGRVKRRQITRLEAEQKLARVTGTTDYSGLRTADVVVEAVFEDLALKQAILRDVEAATREDCIFASNTSSIPIGRIAAAASRPGQVVGMHYFSPVHKMPLLEVVRTDRTEPWVVATAVALGKKQGKTVIVVKDGVGFYTSRILGPYMNEAAHLVAEGVPIDVVDQAMVDWGFPVGPLQLLDEVGIDVAAHVGEVVHAAFGDRMTPPEAMVRVLSDDRKGRKNGRGFYRYDDAASKAASKGSRPVDTSLYVTLGITPRGGATRLPVEEIQMRCALAFVNEALLCLGEGILRSPRDGDIGAVFGLGFPPFRGGPFRFVDTVGAAEVLRRLQGYADRFGRRFAPAPALLEMARKGERFHRDG